MVLQMRKLFSTFPFAANRFICTRRRRRYDKANRETFSYTYDDLTAEGKKLTPEFENPLTQIPVQAG